MSKNESFTAKQSPMHQVHLEALGNTRQDAAALIDWFQEVLLIILQTRRSNYPRIDLSPWLDDLLTLQVNGNLDEQVLSLALDMQKMLEESLLLLGYQYDSKSHLFVMKL